MLFQGTVRDNLLWRNRVSDTEILALLSRLGLEEWIIGLEKGLDTRIDNGGTEFSGGQRKCLLLTRPLWRTWKRRAGRCWLYEKK